MKRILEFLLLIVICVAGAALQWHEHFHLTTHRSVWGFLASLFPYVFCAIIAVRSQSVIPAIAGAAFALMLDAIAHYDVFVQPTGLTSLLSFLFVPLLSTLVFVPLVMLITLVVMRRQEARRSAKQQAARAPRPPKLEPHLR